MMKMIFILLFHFTLIVATTAVSFFEPNGYFSQVLNPVAVYPNIDNCTNYVPTEDCGSICFANETKFTSLMNAVYERANQPIGSVTLSNISFGQVQIPLGIDGDSRCHLEGPLTIVMTRFAQSAISLDNCAISKPRYTMTAFWFIKFQGLSVHCSSCPSTFKQILAKLLNTLHGKPTDDVVARVDVSLQYLYEQTFYFPTPGTPTVNLGMSVIGAAIVYPDGDPTGIDLDALQTALSNAFTPVSAENTLNQYLLNLSKALLTKCVIITCGTNCTV